MSAMYRQILTELNIDDRGPFAYCFEHSINARERARCLVWSFDRRVSLWDPFAYEKMAIWPAGDMALKIKRRKRNVESENANSNQLAGVLLEIVQRLKGKTPKGNMMEKFSRFQQILQMDKNMPKQHNNTSLNILSPKLLSLSHQNDKLTILSPNFLSLHEHPGRELVFCYIFANFYVGTSVSQLLTKLGIRDQRLWTELILEATGAGDAIDTVLKLIDSPKENEQQKLIKVSLCFDFLFVFSNAFRSHL